MNKIVYLHRRNDDNSIFYVGMGNQERVYDKSGRNQYWKNIVRKYGYTYEVIADNLSVEDAYKLEVSLIRKLGRKDLGKGRLVNMTNGGDGHNNPNSEVIKTLIEKNRKNMKPVSQYNRKGELVATYRSLSFASKQTSLSRQHIRDCVNGKTNTCGGYVWVSSNEEYKHDISKWDKGSNAMKGGKNPNAKLVLNEQTGVFYESMSLALKSQTKYSETAFRAKLNGQNKNTTNFKYV